MSLYGVRPEVPEVRRGEVSPGKCELTAVFGAKLGAVSTTCLVASGGIGGDSGRDTFPIVGPLEQGPLLESKLTALCGDNTSAFDP